MKAALTLPVILIMATVLPGCGGSDSADGVRDQPNSFASAKNPIDDFSDNSTGDSSNTVGLASNEVRLTLEVPGSVAPDGELTRRNLRIVTPDQVRVYRTNNSLQELSSVNVQQRTEANGRVVIRFSDGLPLGPDIMIEASFGNTRIRALASDSDRDIKANPYSEYLVREAVGGYTSSEFSQVMTCVNSDSETLCLNKYVWSALSDQVQDFEIDIPTNTNLNSAVDFLSDQADFASYVSAMARYALLDSESSGRITAQSVDYNSIFLGIELGQSFLVSDTSEPGQWGVRIGLEEFIEDNIGIAYVYPGLTLTSFELFNLRVTSLANDIPYERTTVAQTALNDFFHRPASYWDLNTQSTAPGAATLEDGLRLLAERSLYQSITGQESARTIGWTRNPYYLDAYVGGDTSAPDRVLSGYFSAGKAIELRSQGGELKRVRTLENHYLAAIDINLARSEDFDLTQLSGRDYNLVTFSARFGAVGEPVRFEAGNGEWSVSNQAVQQTLTDNIAIARDEDGTVTTTTPDRSGQRSLSHRTAKLSDGDRNIGRLNLYRNVAPATGARPDIGVGASTPDGTLLAFNLDNLEFGGDGLLVAGQKTASTPATGVYRLQGLTSGMDLASNRLVYFQDATLTINSGTSASLKRDGLSVVHDVPQALVSSPDALPGDTLSLTYTTPGEGRVSFTGADLTLEGFVVEGAEQMFLRVVDLSTDEKTLGLVMATRLP